ncbi:MAG: cobalamin biosynthesis protein [Chloroflexi bacterium]|nr:cobalamin biosynthesis protein [Chloroflexota bacterium]
MRVLLLAIMIDWLLGDPPNALHPVAWFGRLAHALESRAPRNNPRAELAYGAGIAAVGITVAAFPALVLGRVLKSRKAGWIGVVGVAAALKMTFAWRGLIQAGESVRCNLQAGAPERVRANLQAMVSRDTESLDPPLLAAAAIESLAENASDAFVAPLFYYQLFGLPGAFVYRAVNTLDSMIGYHGRYEFLGKIPARLDDVLNWIPARLTALLIVAAARLTGAKPRGAWQAMRRDHARTASPNAGYPMSAMAGALDVRLEKVGHYRLNETGRAPRPADIGRAAKIVSVALALATTLSIWFNFLPRIARILANVAVWTLVCSPARSGFCGVPFQARGRDSAKCATSLTTNLDTTPQSALRR